MKNKWHLAWVIPAVIIAVAGLALALVKFSADQQFKRQPVVKITPDLRMRLVAALTTANPEYTEGESPWIAFCNKIKLRNYLPGPLKKFAMPSGSPYTEKYYGSDNTGLKYVFNLEYPQSITTNVYSRVHDIMEKNQFERFRLEFGPGFQSETSYLNISSRQISSASGSSREAFRATLSFASVPLNVETLKLQAVDTSDYNNTKVVHEISLPNPLYRKVAPLDEPAQKLPVTVTHSNMEFTLRAVVAQVQKDAHLMGYRDSPLKDDEAPLPASSFPKGDPVQGYNTVLALNLVNTDPTTSTWIVDWPSITYGKEDIPFRPGSFGTQGSGGGTILLSLYTDVSQLPQPVRISVPLKRGDKFPADEEVTVDFPFPKKGEGLDTTASVALWDKQVAILGLSYGSATYQPSALSRAMPTVYPAQENTLRLFLKSKQGALKNVILKGPDSEFTLDGHGSSSMSYNDLQSLGYDLSRQTFDSATRKYIKPTPEDYTTITLRFVSPRPFPKTFEFVVTPELATGEPVSQNP